ncbi:MAG TPA: hypothetical protein VK783_12640 [Bacteroidia bacterium]|jgi:hypothetical protein|nr:hypothetical protein [Bacteroidia bacterium]
MKKIKLLLASVLIGSSSFSFAQSMWKIQSDLEAHYQLVDYWRSRFNMDSATSEDEILKGKLLSYVSTYPATMKEAFEYLKYYDHLTVLTSDDKAFRIYAWDDGNNDHHNFINVFQYNNSDKIEAALSIQGRDANALKGREYRNMYTLKTKERVYYLVTYIVPTNAKENYSIGMDVFARDPKGGLNDSCQIIVNDTYGTAVNNIEYHLANASGATNHSIYFNKETKMLYVPIIWNDGVISTAYTVYRFKNNYFTEVKQMAKK